MERESLHLRWLWVYHASQERWIHIGANVPSRALSIVGQMYQVIHWLESFTAPIYYITLCYYSAALPGDTLVEIHWSAHVRSHWLHVFGIYSSTDVPSLCQLLVNLTGCHIAVVWKQVCHMLWQIPANITSFLTNTCKNWDLTIFKINDIYNCMSIL